MVSILLCSYNGEKYISKQLDSIKNQTVQADEVIIKDDCSTDRTVEICEQFIKNNSLSWKIIRNENNLGYRLNFLQGLKETSEEIVFLCDQDDIWKSNKIEEMSKEMEANNEIMSLTSTMDLIDEKDDVIKKHLKHPFSKKGDIRKINNKEYYKFPTYLGMTMAIRREVIDNMNLKYGDIVTHDFYCNYFALRMGGVYYLDKALTERRSCGENISHKLRQEQLKNDYKGNDRLRVVNKYIEILELFDKMDKEFGFKEDKDLEQEISLLKKRRECMMSDKILKIIFGEIKLIKNCGLKTTMKDIKASIKGE